MYKFAKKILNTLIPRRQLVRYEVFLRNVYALKFSGSQHQCAVCDKKLSRFISLPTGNLLCPKCGSLNRDRRLWQLLNAEFLKDNITILDFSPSRCLARKMKTLPNINYISTDLSGNFLADYSYDITNMELGDENIDLIICYHILEHITRDTTAMAELYRVLKKGGHAIIQTPFKEGDIYEDYSITSPEERLLHFGQDDHVRFYSVSGLVKRLEKTGFKVDARHYSEDNFYGSSATETVIIVTKA